ncbi:hypothetical protein SASPL_143749 [Salvia splendens]|uniref:Shikimate O-hydroxycinnamoyltransferase n=1 Tax=Salvia splendens TaxID=180675 RepID=A0A8X8WN89_SALSN|nr:hypothetical protein SASPL_143749 [Salvia splendens]
MLYSHHIVGDASSIVRFIKAWNAVAKFGSDDELPDFVQAKKRHVTHLSSFTITTAYVWSGLARSAAKSGEQVAADEPEYFAFAVDGRSRTDLPVPAAYFGNCVGMGLVNRRTRS